MCCSIYIHDVYVDWKVSVSVIVPNANMVVSEIVRGGIPPNMQWIH